MTVGTKLFAEQSVRGFSKIGEELALRQAQISSGKNDPRASVDPVRASRLSVAKEQELLLERFDRNLKQVENRLDQTDSVLNELGNIMVRFRELALRGADDTVSPSERVSLRLEARQLRSSVLDLANARDDTGGALFGGFAKSIVPFVEAQSGVEYQGDRGRHQLRVSETALVETGIDGDSVFMTVQVEDEVKDVFSVLDDFLFSLSDNEVFRESSAQAQNQMGLKLHLQREPENWQFTLTGPGGMTNITLDLQDGGLSNAVTQINAKAAQSGVTARLSDDGQSLILDADGSIDISAIETHPKRRAVLAEVTPFDGADLPQADAVAVLLIPERLDNRTQPTGIIAAGEHFSDRRAEAGGAAQAALRHRDTLTRRDTLIKEAIGQLEDADIARLVTELQQYQLNKDVSYQTFAAISQRSLFNYMG